jgi:hypothetical protein
MVGSTRSRLSAPTGVPALAALAVEAVAAACGPGLGVARICGAGGVPGGAGKALWAAVGAGSGAAEAASGEGKGAPTAGMGCPLK